MNSTAIHAQRVGMHKLRESLKFLRELLRATPYEDEHREIVKRLQRGRELIRLSSYNLEMMQVGEGILEERRHL